MMSGKQKSKGFSITREELKIKIVYFLKNGGGIEKIKTAEPYKIFGEYKQTDRFFGSDTGLIC